MQTCQKGSRVLVNHITATLSNQTVDKELRNLEKFSKGIVRLGLPQETPTVAA